MKCAWNFISSFFHIMKIIKLSLPINKMWQQYNVMLCISKMLKISFLFQKMCQQYNFLNFSLLQCWKLSLTFSKMWIISFQALSHYKCHKNYHFQSIICSRNIAAAAATAAAAAVVAVVVVVYFEAKDITHKFIHMYQ